MNMSRMTPGRFYRLLRDVYGRKSLLTCGVLTGGSVIGTATVEEHDLTCSMTARCASATNPVAPGAASVIPPRMTARRVATCSPSKLLLRVDR